MRQTPTRAVLGSEAAHAQGEAAAQVHVIANGGSGKGCGPDWARELEGKFRGHGLPVRVVLVDSGDDIIARTDEAKRQGARMVVACGGDGTVSAVASRLVDSGIAMAVLPQGTLNHFAKDLGLPLAIDEAVQVAVAGHTIRVDAGEVNGRIFINNSSIGLYPDIVLDRERQRRRLGRGKWRALLAASLHAARRYPVLHLDIEVDGQRISRRSAFAFIGNNEYSMEGFEIGERTGSIRDGKLSLYVTQRTGRFGLLRLAFRALLRRLRQASDFDVITARRIVVDTKHRHMRVATDGEVTLMQTPLDYRIRPQSLRVVVPAPQEGDKR